MGEVLNGLNSEKRDLFIETTEASILADVLHTMPPDDVSAILADLPEAQQEELLRLIKGKAVEQILKDPYTGTERLGRVTGGLDLRCCRSV